MSDTDDGAAFVYDEVAYPTPILPIQTPDVLGASLLMQGFVPPPPETASVLEIGCGNGYNLIGVAAAMPHSQCVGFDLSASAIADGNQLIEAAGLTNVTLVHGDILTWPRDRTYDYITCHGVYTWVPPHVRDATMELVGAVLAPGGVAYIGYDCLPASASKAAINRFLRSEVNDIPDVAERVDAAVRLVNVLASHQLERSRLKSQLDSLVAEAPGYPRAYFFHDWLAEFYNPVSIEEFSAAAERNGLRFAGDSALHDLYENNLDEAGKALVDKAGDDRARRNVVLDMLRGSHMFRGDMLVRRDPPHRVERDPLTRLRFGFPGTRKATGNGSAPGVKYARGEKVFITSTDPLQQKVMDALMSVHPADLSFDELAAAVSLAPSDLKAQLHKLVVMGLLDIHLTKAPFVLVPGDRPKASNLVRAMIRHSHSAISLRHTRFVSEQDPTRLMLILCDGTRTRAGIAGAMSAELGTEVPLERVEAAIAEFARQALFEA